MINYTRKLVGYRHHGRTLSSSTSSESGVKESFNKASTFVKRHQSFLLIAGGTVAFVTSTSTFLAMDHIKNRNEAALLRMKIEDQKLLYERTMKEQQLLYEEKLRSLKSEAELTSTKNYLMYGHSDDYKSLRSHSKDN